MSFHPLLSSNNFAAAWQSTVAPERLARLTATASGAVKAVWSERIANDPKHGYWSSLMVFADRGAALAWIEQRAGGREYGWDSRD